MASGLVSSAHDVSEGGLAACLAECCVSAYDRSPLGAEIDLELGTDVERSLFGEGPSVIVLSAQPGNGAALRSLAEKHGAPLQRIGRSEATSSSWASTFRFRSASSSTPIIMGSSAR
ncbi:MAG: hypothetical protein HC923_03795 [Myxococcales bacterium]|nr:hypothetical protein [Myxococcales bacterium]